MTLAPGTRLGQYEIRAQIGAGAIRRALIRPFVVLCWISSAAAAQDSVVSRAEKLREAGDFGAAVSLLEAHLATSPDDGNAARLLAQTLYWIGDWPRARNVYEAARTRHPQDERLRLEYSRMLAETGDTGGARRLLSPLPAVAQIRADALALLGTLEYWSGDLTAARRFFSDALLLNPTQPEAQRSVQEIRVATAPWIRLSPTFWHDDQPIDRGGATIEGGWFVTPLTALRGRFQPARYTSGNRARTTWSAEGELRQFVPDARLETEIAVGALRRTLASAGSLTWTGRAVLGLRLPAAVTLRARAERTPYLSTTSSLDANVIVRAIAGELHWNHPRGWLGQAVVQQQAYPDQNIVDTTYAWLLAPVVRHRVIDVHTGYAFGADDARASRFVPAQSDRPLLAGDSLVNPTGRYDPYYTPADVVKHAAAAAVTIRRGPRATIRLSGSRSIHAEDMVPILFDDGSQVQRVFVPREFSAWDARAAVEMRTSHALSVTVAADAGRGAFYRWLNAGIDVTYRFVSTAPPPSGPAR